jgi:hypothetical protein
MVAEVARKLGIKRGRMEQLRVQRSQLRQSHGVADSGRNQTFVGFLLVNANKVALRRLLVGQGAELVQVLKAGRDSDGAPHSSWIFSTAALLRSDGAVSEEVALDVVHYREGSL